MKPILIIVVAALFLAHVNDPASAQQRPAPVKVQQFTKIGVVNHGIVYSRFAKVEAFKKDMDRRIQPYKDKKAELNKSIKEWEELLEGKAIFIGRRQAEDLEVNYKEETGKYFDKRMAELSEEVNQQIRSHAAAHGYHMILAYGEPEEPLSPLVDFTRKMKVIDAGGMTVAYAAKDIDISLAVLKSLNGEDHDPETFAKIILAGFTEPFFENSPLAKPRELPATKVGVVNMGTLYTKNQRVNAFRAQMEVDLAPYKKQKEELDKYITQWQNALSDPNPKWLTEKEKQEVIQTMFTYKRRLCDLEFEYKRVMGKTFEDQMIALSKDVNEKIQAYAKAHGFHLVLAYGEPETPLPALMSFTRRMKVVDGGGVTKDFIGDSSDISLGVLTLLNCGVPDSQPVDATPMKSNRSLRIRMPADKIDGPWLKLPPPATR